MSVRLRKWTDKKGKLQEAWTVDVKLQHPDGRIERIRKASPVNTRRGAEQYERELRQALLNGTFGKAQKPEEHMLTLAEFVPRFLTYSENNNKHSSVVTKKFLLEVHLVPFFGEMELDAIGPAQIEDFKALMRTKTSLAHKRKESPTRKSLRRRKPCGQKLLSLKTINATLIVLHKLLSLAQEQGLIEHFSRGKLFKVEKPAFDFLTFEEADRLIAAAEPAWRHLFLLALRSGLRQGELLGLRWSDLDLLRRKLHVRHTIWRGIEGTPKGGRERTVDLPSSVVEALQGKQHQRGGYVFCQADGRPLTVGKVQFQLRRALRRAGIEREVGQIGWHDLRHTYGSHLAMRGVPLKVIQELMGHATIEMTMRYAHLSPEIRESAVQLLDQPSPHATALLAQRHPRGTLGAHDVGVT